jgi:hypothetical protein
MSLKKICKVISKIITKSYNNVFSIIEEMKEDLKDIEYLNSQSSFSSADDFFKNENSFDRSMSESYLSKK